MKQIWWNQMVSTRNMLEEIISDAQAGKSVILSLPAQTPWYKELVEQVRSGLCCCDGRRSFQQMTCPQGDPGQYLLENYCKKETRMDYRPGRSVAAFLAEIEGGILSNRYIWIEQVSPAQLGEWNTFIAEYRKAVPAKKDPGVFILVVNEPVDLRKIKRGLSKIDYTERISAYDRYTFCAVCAQSVKCEDGMRQYLAQLAFAVCGDDMELCAACIRNGIAFLKDPVGVLRQIAQEETHSDGSVYVLPLDDEAILHKVWEAQIKSVFPAIENFRSEFVGKYTDAIAHNLPLQNSAHETVTDPKDVEVGTLYYLANAGRLVDERGNSIIEPHDQDTLYDAREARNHLAHLCALGYDEVESVIKLS